MSGSIIVPIDGSNHSLRALDFAINSAKCTGDRIILLNVQPRFDETWDYTKSDMDVDALQHKAGEELLQKAKEYLEKTDIPYIAKIRLGLPTIEICEEAKENEARCIIMGTRGMGPDVSKALGSVGYGVIHLSPCPLTLVPANY